MEVPRVTLRELVSKPWLSLYNAVLEHFVEWSTLPLITKVRHEQKDACETLEMILICQPFRDT
eukprot:3687922-Amphidinium_carterae.1